MKVIDFSNVGSEIHFRVSWNEKEWNEILDVARAEIAPTLKVKGFRPGKVNLSSVDRFVSTDQILRIAEAVAIERAVKYLSLKKGKETEGYRIYVRTIEKISFEEIQILFKLEKLPKIELTDYKNLKINVPKIVVAPAEIKNRLMAKRLELATFYPKKTGAVQGDQVTIDYFGTVDEKPLKNGSQKAHKLILGSKTLIPGFEEGLIGAEAGEKKKLNLKFPKNYTPDLAGKNVEFTVDVTKVATPSPADDDELIDKWNDPAVRKIDDFEPAIQRIIIAEKKKQNEKELLAIIKKAIISKANITIPKAYLNREFKRMRQAETEALLGDSKKTLLQVLKSKKMTEEQFDKDLTTNLKNLIHEVLLIHQIAKIEKIIVKTAEIDKYYTFLQNYTQKPQKELEKNYPRSTLENHFLRYKVEEFLLNCYQTSKAQDKKNFDSGTDFVATQESSKKNAKKVSSPKKTGAKSKKAPTESLSKK